MAKGILDIIIDSIFDDAWVGRHGEKLTEKELNLVKLFGRKGKTLRNVYLPKDNGETSELDVVYITQKGIFVFESKNYSGWIFGDEKSKYWTVSLPNGIKNKFYNPIMQNRTHLKWMKKFVGEEVPLFSIIVFSERCELKKLLVSSDDVKVIKRDRVYATVRDLWDKNPDAVSEEELDRMYESLKILTNVNEATKAAHVENINRRINKKQPKEATEKSAVRVEETIMEEDRARLTSGNRDFVEQKICPRCGKEVVVRTAKKGENAGNQFWGCSGFPRCRYVEEMEINQ